MPIEKQKASKTKCFGHDNLTVKYPSLTRLRGFGTWRTCEYKPKHTGQAECKWTLRYICWHIQYVSPTQALTVFSYCRYKLVSCHSWAWSWQACLWWVCNWRTGLHLSSYFLLLPLYWHTTKQISSMHCFYFIQAPPRSLKFHLKESLMCLCQLFLHFLWSSFYVLKWSRKQLCSSVSWGNQNMCAWLTPCCRSCMWFALSKTFVHFPTSHSWMSFESQSRGEWYQHVYKDHFTMNGILLDLQYLSLYVWMGVL